MTVMPWFSDDEIDAMCDGLTLNAAKVKYLQAQGLTVTRKPNGRPLVMRDQAERILSGLGTANAEAGAADAPRQPPRANRAAFKLMFGGKAA